MKIHDRHKHRIRKTIVTAGVAAVIVATAHAVHAHPFPVGSEAPGGLPHSVRPVDVTVTPVGTAKSD